MGRDPHLELERTPEHWSRSVTHACRWALIASPDQAVSRANRRSAAPLSCAQPPCHHRQPLGAAARAALPLEGWNDQDRTASARIDDHDLGARGFRES
jgi:hypothetical protein